jgi:hypothetical protein
MEMIGSRSWKEVHQGGTRQAVSRVADIRIPSSIDRSENTTVVLAERFFPKFKWSKTRKRERVAEEDEKIAERKKRQVETKQAAQTNTTTISQRREGCA